MIIEPTIIMSDSDTGIVIIMWHASGVEGGWGGARDGRFAGGHMGKLQAKPGALLVHQ